MKKALIITFSYLALHCGFSQADTVIITSPDGRITSCFIDKGYVTCI
jgi:hypothetical protein